MKIIKRSSNNKNEACFTGSVGDVDRAEITPKDLLAIMIAQFEILMPLVLLLCGVMTLLMYLLTKFWL